MGLLTEEEQDSSENCNFNVTKTPNLDIEDQEFPKEQIERDIDEAIKKSTKYYKEWYSKPETIKKIKNENLIDNLITFLDDIPKYCYWAPDKYDKIKNQRIAWVFFNAGTVGVDLTNNNIKTIFFNAFNIYKDGKYKYDLYTIIHHEIGHLIDGFFSNNDEKLYKKTHKEFSGLDYIKNYIINDQDQFTRLNVLRQTIGAEPNDDSKTLLDKFLNAVNSNKITSKEYKLKSHTTNKKKYKKNDSETSMKVYEKIKNNFYVNDSLEANIPQLFSTFSIINGDDIYVNFDLISQLNIDTAKNTEDNDKEILVTSILGENKKYTNWLVMTPIKN